MSYNNMLVPGVLLAVITETDPLFVGVVVLCVQATTVNDVHETSLHRPSTAGTVTIRNWGRRISISEYVSIPNLIIMYAHVPEYQYTLHKIQLLYFEKVTEAVHAI